MHVHLPSQSSMFFSFKTIWQLGLFSDFFLRKAVHSDFTICCPCQEVQGLLTAGSHLDLEKGTPRAAPPHPAPVRSRLCGRFPGQAETDDGQGARVGGQAEQPPVPMCGDPIGSPSSRGRACGHLQALSDHQRQQGGSDSGDPEADAQWG